MELDTAKMKDLVSTPADLKPVQLPAFRQQLLNPWPRLHWKVLLISALLVVMYVWGLQGTQADPAELVAGIPNIIGFIGRLFPPEFTLPPPL
jgi:hypothetical protein